jgi:hypothetical protein
MRKATIFIAGVCLLLLCAVPAYGQEVPPLPHAFYGDVTINGNPAPVGTQVEARGEGVRTGIPGNPIVTTEVGKYGSADPLGTKLVVQGNIADGATLTFYVNGVSTGQTATWHSGETSRKDLAVTITVVPPTVVTSAATAIGTTTATLNGSLTNLGTATSVQVSFEWGLTTTYGSQTSPQTMTGIGSFSAALTSLSSSTTYHFRAKAVGADTGYGLDMTFTTRTPAAGGGGGGAADTTPPTISDISVSNITKTSADIVWKTNEMSDSQVEYWSSPGEFSPLDTERVINHLVHLTELTPGTTYHYKTMSRDAADNLAVSDEHTFTTLGLPPTFTTSDLSISPTEVDIGEKVTISAVVANTGDAKGTYEVTLKINGVIEETKKVDVDAGASKTVTFTTVKDVAGSYAVAVDGLTGSFSVVAPAMFSLSNLSVTPQEVKPKEAVTITVSVANTGGTQGSYTVVLKIDEVKEAEKTITVAAGSSQSVSFTVTRDVAGTYAVVVDGLTGSFSVTPPVKLNWPVVGGIIGGVVIIGLLVFFLVRRRAA